MQTGEDASGLSAAALAAVSCAGEYMIQAAAALWQLTPHEHARIAQMTDGRLPWSIVVGLEGAAMASPQVRHSLRTHPPQGLAICVRTNTKTPNARESLAPLVPLGLQRRILELVDRCAKLQAKGLDCEAVAARNELEQLLDGRSA